MFTLGWQVFRRHVTDVLDPARVRRAAAWSGIAAIPEHRDIVRTDTVLLRRGMIGVLARVAPVVAAGVAAVLAAFILGNASWFHVLWMAGYVLVLSEYVVRLGRSERARLAAEALAPVPETPAARIE
ncbi:hypothetical protein [Curtobacterium sp. VKM Ac-1376]|uniref:hypothetical protein n=1 Tax=Curtobacterium sp. VKM Ac-1376 TaxID=123312 RepID=UPI00188A6753|nr:hypothetical protein [Curtobacterium sp. VKM Ac-1376]MBF4614163.1 hypothetical protein [Curtobacterium sp. VKM Ac-1376]